MKAALKGYGYNVELTLVQLQRLVSIYLHGGCSGEEIDQKGRRWDCRARSYGIAMIERGSRFRRRLDVSIKDIEREIKRLEAAALAEELGLGGIDIFV